MAMDSIRKRIQVLHRQLCELQDAHQLAEIHMELGTMAVADGKFPQANRHFREALWWDPGLDQARVALHALGEWVDQKASDSRGGGVIKFLLGQLRRPDRTQPA